MTGLYIHVPFCKKKCHYCNFVIALSGSGAGHNAFLGALEKEAAHHAPRFKDTVFDTLYLGGGTPSLLEADEFQWLFHILKNHFRWRDKVEVTCEVNPGDVDLKKAFLLKKLGINRASLGAQSFHDETLKRLNRTHHAGDIESSSRYLRDAGIENISLDLMLSLPGESWEQARVSLEKAVALKPEHFSIYELTIEEKTVFGLLQHEGKLGMPEEEEQISILSNARTFLQEAGYRHYELLSYAKPGYESRHNRIYWDNQEYLGLGPGAFSYLNGCRFRHADSYERYMAKASAGDWSAQEEEVLTPDQKQIESFLLALRLAEGAAVERFPSVLRDFPDELTDLQEKGLLVLSQDRFMLSPKGQFFAETVFSELSAPGPGGPNRTKKGHSRNY